MREPNDVTPCDAGEITHWDDTADVIVVGFGAAGSAAAFSAAAAGAQVLVTERTGGPGGAAALAEGIVYLGGGTPIQTACGFEDSLDDMYRYMMAACGPDPNEAKIARYCEESLGHFDWLVARGVPFDPTFCADTSMAPDGTEGLVYSGGEDAYPFNEIARPAPRGHLAKTKRSTGWLLMQHLAAAATGAGAVVSTDTRVDRLVCDDGRVVGVQAQRFGETVTLAGPARRRAHRGRLHLQRRHAAPALPAAGAGDVQGGHRGRRRAGHPHGAGPRRFRPQHVRRRGVAAHHPAADPDPRHPRQRPGAALHQRGHLHGTGRPVRPLRAGRRGLPDRRRGLLRGELDGTRRHLGLRDGGAARVRDRPAGRVAAEHRRPVQPSRGERGGPPLPQGPLLGAAAGAAYRRGRPAHRAGALRALHPGRPGDDGGRRGAATSPGRRSAGCSPPGAPRPGSARSATPAGSPSGTARCSAASPARVPRQPRLRPESGVHPGAQSDSVVDN